MASHAGGRGGLQICRRHFSGRCKWMCGKLHKQFHWQVDTGQQGWAAVENEDQIEMAYSNPATSMAELESVISVSGNPLCEVRMQVELDDMLAQVQPAGGTLTQAKVQRLSTPSYAEVALEQYHEHSTVWTWYWQTQGNWKKFGQDCPCPLQSVIEAKYLAGQEIFRFEVDLTDSAKAPAVMLINFTSMKLQLLQDNLQWPLKRRPEHNVPAHERKPLPYEIELPANWKPVDVQHEFELVPLNPESMDYHLVASEFSRTIKNHQIQDIFRLQNVHLWHKYSSKKKYMESRGKKPNETQLFHGTSSSEVVQSIFTQNFDWRCAGKNGTCFGKGAYFARDANYSDRYTGEARELHWMFMARVLIGEHTLGKADYVRPPPKNPAKPHGDLYDSCVNSVQNPAIYVVFDNDQCYPEYAICYNKKTGVNSTR